MDVQLGGRIRRAAQLLIERGAKDVYVFGSVLAGPLREDSDVDFAVTGLPAGIFFRAMAETAGIVGRPVDIVDLDRDPEIAQSLRRFEQLENVNQL